MFVDFLLEVFEQNRDAEAIIWRDRAYTYGWMLDAFDRWMAQLYAEDLKAGSIVALDADFSPNATALMLAMVERGYIIVPLAEAVEAHKPEFLDIAQVEAVVGVDGKDNVSFTKREAVVDSKLLLGLKSSGHPGLVLFSSGSTGKSKGIVHDFVPLFDKHKERRKPMRTITFLLFDHIGGINTLFYVLSNGGCVITVQDRSPDAVCGAVEKYRVQLLPTSPTFVNLILLSEAYQRYDLSSLEVVSYGTEVMPESTLKRFHELFPDIRAVQTYGLSEVGIMRSKSKSSDSLWVKVGGEGFDTRIRDGMLEIKAETAMLGYLNAPDPFTGDGWFKTGDAVEVDGEYIRILGRKSELINVGGAKVYPAEVESVLQMMEGVREAAVSGEPNPITGHIVKARVRLDTGEGTAQFAKRMRAFCKDKLANYKVPQKVALVEEKLHSGRFKKMRLEKKSPAA